MSSSDSVNGTVHHHDELRSRKARLVDPAVDDDDLATVSAGQAAFALDLYQSIRGETGNLVHSPFGIFQTLAMACAGARGDTEREIARVAHLGLPQARLHPAINAVEQMLRAAVGAEAAASELHRLEMAAAIWNQSGYAIDEKYLDLLALNYGAGLLTVDFRSAPGRASAHINDWVQAQTGGTIRDLLATDAIKADTRMVLASAVYLKAAWKAPFEQSRTHEAPFQQLDGSAVPIAMMTTTDDLRLGQGDGYRTVELPYANDRLSMVIVLPDAGRFAEIESELARVIRDDLASDEATTNVELHLPRFEITAELDLVQALKALGLNSAFSQEAADFSAITQDERLHIGAMRHKALVAVDEAGAEAAAATAVIAVGSVAYEPPPPRLVVDRPFVFLIRDAPTGVILFLGRVVTLSP